MNKYSRGFGLYLVIFTFILFAVFASRLMNPPEEGERYDYHDLIRDLRSGAIEKLEITLDLDSAATGRATAHLGNDESHTVIILSVPNFIAEKNAALQYHNFEVVNLPVPRSGIFSQIWPFMLVMGISIFILFVVLQQSQGGGKAMNFGKSRAKIAVDTKHKITFDQVAGLDEEKEELAEVVDFLKDPKKFVDIGARIPRGVLLVGPPGTGKTYLAKAVSGEAGVPFFSISGSDFVEMFVGVGASRVRDLFEQAKKNIPCIVFIDEIDAVGRRRGAGLGGGHDEREQTLNQLLVEMDGFAVNEGVIIIAATNRPDILDPALLRPGRFDRQVVVGRPDVKGREAVLKIHTKKKKIGKSVDLKVVAQTTAGFTPADLENLVNEAALLAARDNKTEVEMEHFRKAFIKVGVGTEKKSRVMSEKERRITAFHEAGHALLFEILEEEDPTYIVSIIPTGRAGGYAMPLPGEDKTYMTKRRMEQDIVASLGGRAAEELVLDDITTGASADIQRSTAIARAMVTKYGMSSLGPILFGDENQEVFIGRDFAQARNYGEAVATDIDNEIKRIVETSYSIAIELINQHIDVLHKIAELLLEKEKVSGEEIRKLFPEGVLTKEIKCNEIMVTDNDSGTDNDNSTDDDTKENKAKENEQPKES